MIKAVTNAYVFKWNFFLQRCQPTCSYSLSVSQLKVAISMPSLVLDTKKIWAIHIHRCEWIRMANDGITLNKVLSAKCRSQKLCTYKYRADSDNTMIGQQRSTLGAARAVKDTQNYCREWAQRVNHLESLYCDTYLTTIRMCVPYSCVTNTAMYKCIQLL